MDDITPGVGQEDLVRFEGEWGEYLRIAIVNLLLTIVTIGIYRFWAKAKVRRYLWSRTSVMGEPLEYTGTGGELFIGALIVLFAVLLPLSIAFNVVSGLHLAGQTVAAMSLTVLLWGALLYLLGVGTYRAQRYLLSRTSWRGIRGGMVAGGWAFGISFLWRNVVGVVTLFLAMPWASTQLWNERWSDARFGSLEFKADAPAKPLFQRYLPVWGVVAITGVAFFGLSADLRQVFSGFGSGEAPTPEFMAAFDKTFGLMILWYLTIVVGAFLYQVFYWRHIVSHTRLDGLQLSFNATLKDWVLFLLGNAAIVGFTLGLGLIMIPYRIYSFALGHLAAEGALDPTAIAQSRLDAPVQGEGLADAFDLSPV